MRISLNWLREYIRLPETPDTVARALTEHTFETTVIPAVPRASLDAVHVGEVLTVTKHPQADRLSVVRVRLVKGEERDIVCGAPNVRVGLRVAVALPGTRVFTKEGTLEPLTEATIRGVTSRGMICSERELGLGDDRGGILELPSDAPLGCPIASLFPPDVLLEADILPDRAPDATSHIGVARELGAMLNRPVRLPVSTLPKKLRQPSFAVRIDRDVCTRYIAVQVDDVHPVPSPSWMQQRLRAIGIHPQNLLVDVTNYVLWEVGQPTHVFDARAIGTTLGVEAVTRDGMPFTGLDGVARELPERSVVITSDGTPIALAGIIGGADSGVREDTTSVVIESALFDRGSMRKAVQEIGLRTDASDRFSRGVTGYAVAAGAARVAELLVKHGGGKITAVRDLYPKPPKPRVIAVSTETIEGILGMPVRATVARTILKRLGYGVAGTTDVLRVTSPPFRADVAIPEDVVEDIGRILGYDRLPAPLPVAPIVPTSLPESLQDVRRIQDALRGAGWMEAYTYSFMQEEEALALQLHTIEHLQIVNPINRDHVRLRTNLLPNLLHLAWAAVKKEPLVRIFELGTVYPAKSDERRHVAGTLIRRGPARRSLGEGGETTKEDFYEVKGIVEHLLAELGIPDVWFDPTDPAPQDSFLFTWDPSASAEVKIGDQEIGFVGRIHRDILERLGIQGSVTAFEIDLARLADVERIERTYHPPLLYPTVERDVSFLAPEHVLVDELRQAITGAGGSLIQNVRFLDMYEDEKGRSVTLRVTYGSPERTLRDEEVNELHGKIVAAVEEKLDVERRG